MFAASKRSASARPTDTTALLLDEVFLLFEAAEAFDDLEDDFFEVAAFFLDFAAALVDFAGTFLGAGLGFLGSSTIAKRRASCETVVQRSRRSSTHNESISLAEEGCAAGLDGLPLRT